MTPELVTINRLFKECCLENYLYENKMSVFFNPKIRLETVIHVIGNFQENVSE